MMTGGRRSGCSPPVRLSPRRPWCPEKIPFLVVESGVPAIAALARQQFESAVGDAIPELRYGLPELKVFDALHTVEFRQGCGFVSFLPVPTPASLSRRGMDTNRGGSDLDAPAAIAIAAVKFPQGDQQWGSLFSLDQALVAVTPSDLIQAANFSQIDPTLRLGSSREESHDGQHRGKEKKVGESFGHAPSLTTLGVSRVASSDRTRIPSRKCRWEASESLPPVWAEVCPWSR